jgi:hypothetical protein
MEKQAFAANFHLVYRLIIAFLHFIDNNLLNYEALLKIIFAL